jgi:hypothetical protein
MLADKAVSIITEAAKAGEHTELADAAIACFSVTCLAGTSRREQAIEQARAITPPYMAALALFSISGVLELREEKAAAEVLRAEAAKMADTVNIDELNADPKSKGMVETFFGLWVQNREYGKALLLLVYLYDALVRNGDKLSGDDQKILSQIVDQCLAVKP